MGVWFRKGDRVRWFGQALYVFNRRITAETRGTVVHNSESEYVTILRDGKKNPERYPSRWVIRVEAGHGGNQAGVGVLPAPVSRAPKVPHLCMGQGAGEANQAGGQGRPAQEATLARRKETPEGAA